MHDGRVADRDYRHNFLVLTADGLLFFLGMAFISFEAVLPVFLVRLGAPALAIAVLPVVQAIGVHLPSILVSARIERSPRKLPILLRYSIWQRLPWALVAVLIPLLAVGRPGAMIAVTLAAAAVTTFAAGLVLPAFFGIIASTIPADRRGGLFALRSVVSYLFGIGAGVLVRVILERTVFPANYTLLFAIATGTLFAGWYVFSRVREPSPAAADGAATAAAEPAPAGPVRGPTPMRTLRRSVAIARDVLASSAGFMAYNAMRVVLMLSFAATAFFPVYIVDRLGLGDGAAGVFSILTAATFVVVNPAFGFVGDRIGYKPLFVVSFVALIACSAIGLFATSAFWLYSLIVLSAISRSVNLFAWNMTIEYAPPGRTPSFIGASGLVIGLVAPLAIATGWIVDAFGYGALFAFTGATAIAGATILLLRVREPRLAHREINRPDAPA